MANSFEEGNVYFIHIKKLDKITNMVCLENYKTIINIKYNDLMTITHSDVVWGAVGAAP